MLYVLPHCSGIWCILPSSFPENVTVNTTHNKKKKINVSYPNAVLNSMVKDNFTNDQYYELTDPEKKTYEQRYDLIACYCKLKVKIL